MQVHEAGLSPLLFSLAMELAAALRGGGAEWGTALGDGLHVVSLYADYLLLYFRDVTRIPSEIGTLLQRFAMISGPRINWSKSCLFPFDPALLDPGLCLAGGPVPWQPHTIWRQAARGEAEQKLHQPKDTLTSYRSEVEEGHRHGLIYIQTVG
ncbi:hypothetical protein NDU88_008462 [Pleurodeles waltl]|uniref:Reverse transcriptase domain-containing protein n=1 Tax=Pleurodeles waltl TaxID=8319 RepID=A0AAV7QSL4_PLEWA|nr:hypothetical protein NDU88_008462 [Pleurodeles waltl]